MKKLTLKLSVYGIVQGVGFRPYVYTLAKKLNLNGSVQNCLDKVEIVVSGSVSVIEQFKAELITNLPPLAQISNLEIEVIDNNNFTEFKILSSSNFINQGSIQNAVLPADLKICKECLAELIDPNNFRFNYPFINCTNCGPRMSIIRALPYDRQNTSMVDFKLCAVCLAEYEDPLNRRFHAQPIACKNCGPQLIFQNETNLCYADKAFNMAIQALKEGKLIAVKGLGGFHLICDALNIEAISYLRKAKQRSIKPLALMMLDVNMVLQYCDLSKYQEKILTSYYAPIVLLDKKANTNLPELIAPHLVNLGVMLAYTPLHYRLIAKLNRPIIATSANLSDEPIVIENEEAKSRLQNITKIFLMHNRDILHRYDDSVVNTVNDQTQVIRMGRGLAPYFFSTTIENKYNILALGANQKNTFCLLTGHKAILSQHIGDMLRVPGSSMDLFKAKASGANLKIVYSPLDALKVALANPCKNIVFFAIGFETTAPANAMLILQAKKLNLKNFFVLCHEVLVPPIIASLLEAKESSIQAFLGPGHVCSVMGLHEYENLVHNYQLPIVVTGFEPLDILEGIYACVQQLNNNGVRLENQYARAVTQDGNIPAQQAIKDVFEVCDRKWRGLGFIPKSGLSLNSQFKDFDATIKFKVDNLDIQESKECISGEILRGLKKPPQCVCFGTKCTPLNPLGATMVSSEGACSAYYKYRQSKLIASS